MRIYFKTVTLQRLCKGMVFQCSLVQSLVLRVKISQRNSCENGGLDFTNSIPYTSNCGEKDFTERSNFSSVTDSCA